jgi:hypothetical protein
LFGHITWDSFLTLPGGLILHNEGTVSAGGKCHGHNFKGIFLLEGLRPIKEVMGRNLIDRSISAGYGDSGFCNHQM